MSEYQQEYQDWLDHQYDLWWQAQEEEFLEQQLKEKNDKI